MTLENTLERRRYLAGCLVACANGCRESFTDELFSECANLLLQPNPTFDIILSRLRQMAKVAEEKEHTAREIKLLRVIADLKEFFSECDPSGACLLHGGRCWTHSR